MSPRTAERWRRWVDRWDRQQERYIPEREDRFRAILEVIEAAGPSDATVLDLGCGPGSLSVRLLRRMPRATVYAVDVDPVLPTVGRRAFGDLGGRLHWVAADLRRRDWLKALPILRFDAAASTTALHWLPPTDLRRVYRDLAERLRPGGVLANGDHLPSSDSNAAWRRILRRRRRSGRSAVRPPGSTWGEFWRALAREPSLREEFRRRRRLFPGTHAKETHLYLEDHLRALRRAGFGSVGTVWQEFDDRVIFAVR